VFVLTVEQQVQTYSSELRSLKTKQKPEDNGSHMTNTNSPPNLCPLALKLWY